MSITILTAAGVHTWPGGFSSSMTRDTPVCTVRVARFFFAGLERRSGAVVVSATPVAGCSAVASSDGAAWDSMVMENEGSGVGRERHNPSSP
jgi:hypothetical protein